MSAAEPPVTEDGFDIDRNGTIEHLGFGPITRVVNGVPVGSIRFVVEITTGCTVYIEYTREEFEAAWGETLFEDPVLAEERRQELQEEAETDV